MRRLFAIILLLVLPLQFSWAAVSGYCGHETNTSEQHLGHHAHEHEDAENDSPDPAPFGVGGEHADCASCHAGCAVAIPLAAGFAFGEPRSQLGDSHQLRAALAPFDRPERPKWLALA